MFGPKAMMNFLIFLVTCLGSFDIKSINFEEIRSFYEISLDLADTEEFFDMALYNLPFIDSQGQIKQGVSALSEIKKQIELPEFEIKDGKIIFVSKVIRDLKELKELHDFLNKDSTQVNLLDYNHDWRSILKGIYFRNYVIYELAIRTALTGMSKAKNEMQKANLLLLKEKMISSFPKKELSEIFSFIDESEILNNEDRQEQIFKTLLLNHQFSKANLTKHFHKDEL